jgi:hypothetical protein
MVITMIVILGSQLIKCLRGNVVVCVHWIVMGRMMAKFEPQRILSFEYAIDSVQLLCDLFDIRGYDVCMCV